MFSNNSPLIHVNHECTWVYWGLGMFVEKIQILTFRLLIVLESLKLDVDLLWYIA